MNASPQTMTWRGKTGIFVETYHSKIGVSVDWKIPHIFPMLSTKSDYYTSPSLKFSDSIWYLSIYPKGKTWTSKWITLVLNRTNVEDSVCASVGIKAADGSEEEIIRQSVFTERQKSFVFSEFLNSTDLTNRRLQLVPSHSLTVTCTLWREAPSSTLGRMDAVCGRWKDYDSRVRLQERANIDEKSISLLRKQFEDLLSSGEDHDVTIQVRDREFNVHKCILRARSTVFEAMFRHKMKESTDGSISIEDCDPDAFGRFLRYVYTGAVDDLSLSNAMELYYIADKYDSSCLKEVCLHYLRAHLSVTAVCDVITLAKNHGECKLLEEAIGFFVENTKEILTTPEWRCFVKTNPDEANELYIQSFEIVREKE